MNIALISAEYPPETAFGGLGSYIYKLAHALTALNHKVIVVSSTLKGKSVSVQIDGEVTVYRVPRPVYDLKGLGFSVNNVIYSFRLYSVLKDLLPKHSIHVIQFPEYQGEGLFHSLLNHTPYVIRFSTPRWLVEDLNRGDSYPKGPRTFLNRVIVQWAENIPVKKGRAFIFPCRDIKNLMERRVSLKGIKRVIYTGVDVERFKPNDDLELRKKYGLDSVPVVLYVGRLEFRKGVHILAEATRRIVDRFPGVRIAFVGADTRSAPSGGSMRAYMEQIFRKHRLEKEAIFVGGIGHKDVARIYGLGDILVVPSLYENLANVMLEGMAAGLPIVTTSSGGSPEVIAHGTNGLVVPPGDTEALASAILELLMDPGMRKQISCNNREKVLKELSLEKMAQETLDVYAELLSGNPGHGGNFIISDRNRCRMEVKL